MANLSICSHRHGGVALQALIRHNLHCVGAHHLVDGDGQHAAIQRGQADRLALNDVNEVNLVSVDQIVSTAAFVILATAVQLELHDQVSGLLLRLLVSFALVCEYAVIKHAWSHDQVDVSVLCLDSAAVKTDDLLLVPHALLGAVVDLAQGNRHSDLDVTHPRRSRLIHTSKCGPKNGAFQLHSSVVTNVEERVHLHEEFFKDFIAVLLVLVSTAEHYSFMREGRFAYHRRGP